MHVRRGLALAAVCSLPLSLLTAGLTATPTAGAAPAAAASGWFNRVATYPVFQNVPAGVDPADPTVAEISAVTEDGNTVIYTDALGKRIGFVDITDPGNPVGDGTLDLSELGDADDQPTSVEVAGDYVLVVVDTSGGSFTDPSGRLDVVRISDRERVTSIDLGGQPDSIKVSPDGTYAAIAMENQRDEDFTPEGAEEGDLPQPPAGFVQLVELDREPGDWEAEPIALPADQLTGITAPEDPEPEYVDINDDNQLVVTLQENNGLVVIDLATRTIEHAFSAGEATVAGVDTDNDGIFDFSDTITEEREPDSVQWVGDDLVATANEGDWLGGSRGWTVFDVTTGEPVWDAGSSFENLAVEHGLFNNDRADNKGAEPEGLAFDTIAGTPYAFVGAERSNFVAVYDMTDPRNPAFRQVLPATNGPEGLLPIPSRNLLVVSSEEDDASALVRASVGVYLLGPTKPAFPSIRSATLPGETAPIGWGALGALSRAPGQPNRLWAASDAAYATGRIYSVDIARAPAVIDRVIEVTDGPEQPALDIEGLAARPGGGFWIANEGATGADNSLIRTDAAGVVQETVTLPAEVSSKLGKWGLEGVAVQGSGGSEVLYVALQRALAGETAARIGRYDVARGKWSWFGYPLSTTAVAGDWIGLSEITVVDGNTLAVVERDKQNGTTAAFKRVYTVDVDRPAATSGVPPVLTKRLAVDLLPAMRAQRGWTQEKVEGLGITSNGKVFAVTDNDGLEDATGETQLFSLGNLKRAFRASVATKTKLTVSKRKIRKGRKVRLVAKVSPALVDGRVRFLDRGKVLRRARLVDGRAVVRLRLKPGTRVLRAAYTGAVDATGSRSKPVKVRVVRRR